MELRPLVTQFRKEIMLVRFYHYDKMLEIICRKEAMFGLTLVKDLVQGQEDQLH